MEKQKADSEKALIQHNSLFNILLVLSCFCVFS